LLDPSASPIAALLPVGLSEELRQALTHHGVVWHFWHHGAAGRSPYRRRAPVQAKKQKLLHLSGANAPAGAAYNFAPVSTHMSALSGRVHHL